MTEQQGVQVIALLTSIQGQQVVILEAVRWCFVATGIVIFFSVFNALRRL